MAGEIQGLDEAHGPLKVNVKADVEFYFEEGELRVPAIFEPTAAEIKAGFG